MFLTRSLLTLTLCALPIAAQADKPLPAPIAPAAEDAVTLALNGRTEVLAVVPSQEQPGTGWMDGGDGASGDSLSGGFVARGVQGDWLVVIDVIDGVVTWGSLVPPSGETLFQENPAVDWRLNDDGTLFLTGSVEPPEAQTRMTFTVTVPQMQE